MKQFLRLEASKTAVGILETGAALIPEEEAGQHIGILLYGCVTNAREFLSKATESDDTEAMLRQLAHIVDSALTLFALAEVHPDAEGPSQQVFEEFLAKPKQ